MLHTYLSPASRRLLSYGSFPQRFSDELEDAEVLMNLTKNLVTQTSNAVVAAIAVESTCKLGLASGYDAVIPGSLVDLNVGKTDFQQHGG